MHVLGPEIIFPSIENSDADGLLAVGGDLSPERLLLAYRSGIFPWYEKDQPILWWSRILEGFISAAFKSF